MNNNGFRRLGRSSHHRKAMLRNMSASFFQHEALVTTVAKAKEVRRIVEKTITRAKQDTLHNRRLVMGYLQNRSLVHKLFTDLGVHYAQRPGGYTRIYKLVPRRGDAANMAQIAMVDRERKQKGHFSKVDVQALEEAKKKKKTTSKIITAEEGAKKVKKVKATTQSSSGVNRRSGMRGK